MEKEVIFTANRPTNIDKRYAIDCLISCGFYLEMKVRELLFEGELRQNDGSKSFTALTLNVADASDRYSCSPVT